MEIVQVKVKQALPEDFKIDDATLKIGVPYWLKSSITGEFTNQNYITTQDTDVLELADYLRLKMVYIPLSYFELMEFNNTKKSA